MKEISKSEEQIMITIWNAADAPSMKSVHVDVNKNFDHEWKHQTISTFLRRLCDKGWLSWERKGRYVYYTPVISKEEYRKSKLNELLNNLYDGDANTLKEDI